MLFYCFGLVIFTSLGLLSMGFFVFAIGICLTQLLVSSRVALMCFIIAVFAVACLSVFHLLGLTQLMDLALPTLISVSTWITQILSFICLMSILLLVSSSVHNALIKTTDDAVTTKEHYRGLIEGLDDVIYTINSDGQFQLVNKEFEAFTGISREQATHQYFQDLFEKGLLSGKNASRWMSYFNQMKAEKKPIAFQMEINKPSGEFVHDVKLIPIFNEMGELETIIGTHRDITELISVKNQMNVLLMDENEKLAQLVQEKTIAFERSLTELVKKERLASLGTLVAGVAHEANTPIGNALTGVSFMEFQIDQLSTFNNEVGWSHEDWSTAIDNLKEAEQLITRNLERAADVVQNFKRVAVSQNEMKLEDFDLTEVIQSTVYMLSLEYQRNSLCIKMKNQEPMYIYSYPSAYYQIVTNLIQNALIHGIKDKEDGVIELEHILQEDILVVQIRDNGVGIAPEVLPRVFDPFFTTSRETGGDGLGLSIVHHLVT